MRPRRSDRIRIAAARAAEAAGDWGNLNPRVRRISVAAILMAIAGSVLVAATIQRAAEATLKPLAGEAIIKGANPLTQYQTDQDPTFVIDSAGSVVQSQAAKFKQTFKAQKGQILASLDGDAGEQPEIATGSSADQFVVKLPHDGGLKPGRYKLTVKVIDAAGKQKTLTQDFTWGVLAVNTDQSSYQPDQPVGFGLGVLNDQGHTLCDAKVTLNISGAGWENKTLSTADGTVKVSSDCQDGNVTTKPDYFATYQPPHAGSYDVEVKAETKNGPRTTKLSFNVTHHPDMIVRRSDTSMRINPAATYTVNLDVTAFGKSADHIRETVPASFGLSKISDGGKVVDKTDQTQTIDWPVQLDKGTKVSLHYDYKAPEIIPQFYKLAMTAKQGGATVFNEPRPWQIAVDGQGDVILLWDTANGAVPSGWTCVSCASGDAFFQRFPFAAATPGTQAGGSETPTHTYTVNSSTGPNTTVAFTTPITGANVASDAHTHSWGGPYTSGTGSILPPYQNLQLIKKNNPLTLPQNVIGMFDVANANLPSGWSHYAAMDGNYLRGENTNTTGGAATHTHTRPQTSNVTSGAASGVTSVQNTGANGASSATHTHTITAASDPNSANNNPSYALLNFAKNTVSSANLPNGLIGLFDNSSLPAGWTSLSSANTSLYLNNSTQYLTAGSGGNVSTAFTLEAWVTYNQTGASQSIISKWLTAGAGSSYDFTIDSTGHLSLIFQDSSSGTHSVTSASTVSTGVSHHVATTYNGSTIRLFIDGTLDANTGSTSTTVNSSAQTLEVGANANTGTEPFNGSIDEARVSSTARYTASFTPSRSEFSSDGNTVALWHFNEGSGTSAADATGNNNGTLQGSAGWTAGMVGTYYYDRLLKGASDPTASTTGGFDNHCHQDSGKYCVETITSGGPSALGNNTALLNTVASTTHTHNVNFGVGSANSLPNYTTAVLAKLKLVTISGTVYSDEGSTAITSGPSIKSAFTGPNDQGTRSATANGSGVYTMDIPDPGAGRQIHVWIDGAAATGAAATRSDGSASNISGLDIYQNRLILRHEDAGPIANTDIGQCTKTKGTQCTDSDLHYDTDGSNNLTVDGDWRLYIWGGKNFTPGAQVTTSARTASPGGDIKWGSSTSTLAMAGNALSVGGDWINSNNGVFTNSGSQTTTFTGNQAATTYTIDPGTNANNTFLNLTFNASANGLWSVRGNKLITTGDLTMTAGTFGDSSDTADIEIQGNVSCGATCGTINAVASGKTFKQNVAAAKNFGTNVITGTVWTFNNLTFASSSGSQTITTSSSGTGNIVTNSVLTIGSSTTLDAGNRTFELDGNGTPFVKTGTLTQNTSTFLYKPSGTSGVTVANATYHHITFNKTGNTFSLTTSGITTDTANSGGNLTITAGTLDTVSGQNYAISVGGNWSNSDTFSAQNGTVTFAATGTGHTISGNLTGSNKFYNLIFNGSGGAWSFGSTAADVGNDMTITNGTVTAPSTTLTITGSYSNAATFTHNSGTVLFNSTATGKTINSGGSNFNNLTFNGSGGDWTIQTNALTAVGNFVVTQGTVKDSSVNVTVNGNVDCGSSVSTCGQINLTGGTFNQRATSAAVDFGPNATAAYNTNWIFNNLSFEDGRGSTSNPVTVTVNSNSGTTILNPTGNLTIGNAGDPSGNVTTVDDSGTNKRPITVGGDVNVTSKGSFTAPGSGLAFNVAGNWTNSNTFTHNSGTVTFNGTASGKTINANGSSGNFNNVTFNGSGGVWSPNTTAMNVTGDLTMTAGTLDGSTGTATDVTVNGNAVGTAGVINFTASNTFTQRVGSAKNFGPTTAGTNWAFNNLTFSNSNGGATPVTITTQNGTGTMTVSGTMKIGASGDASGATTTLDAANRSWTISGSGTGSSAPFQILASPAGSLTASTSTFNFTGSATTDVQSATYYKLVINHSGVTFNAGGGISANSDLSVSAGTFAMAGNNLTVGSLGVSNSGTIAVAGTLTQTASGTTTVLTSSGGSATVGGAGTLTFYNLSFLPTGASASTFTLGSGASQTITASNNLTVGDGTHSVTVTANTNDPALTVGNNVTIAASGTLVAPPTNAFNVGGNWANSGTFTHNSGTVTFNGTSTGHTINQGGSNFNNVTFNGSGGAWSPLTTTMVLVGSLTMTAGTFDNATGSADVTVQNNVGGTAGVINFSNNTFTHKATGGNKTFGTTSGSTAWTFNNLTFDNDGSARTITANSGGSGNIKISSGLTITSSTTLDASSRTFELAGSGTPFTLNGTLTPSTSTFNYTGTSATAITVPTTSYYNLGAGINNDGAAAGVTYTLGGSLTVTNVLTVGNASSTNSDTLAGSSFTLTLSGSGTPFVLTSKGLYSAGTSTVNYTATGGNANIAATTYYNLGAGTTSDGSTGRTFTLLGNTTVTNVLTVGNAISTNTDTLAGSSFTLTLSGSGTPFVITSKGTYSAGTSTVNYTGTSATDVAAVTYYNLGVGTTADGTAVTYSLTGNTTVNNVLTIGNASSTATDALAGLTYTLTLAGSGTPLNATANGTYTVGTSNVKYEGTSATNVAALPYYDLGIGTANDGNAVTFTLLGDASVAHVLTLGNASSTATDSFDLSNKTLTLSGSGTPVVVTAHGQLTPSTSTVNYTGTSATNVGNLTYYNLGVGTTADSNAVTYTLLGNTTVNHVLTVGNASSTVVDTLAGSSFILTLAGSGTGGSQPFQVTSQGAYSVGTSTVNYTGTSTTDIYPVNYYNLGVGTTANGNATTYNVTGNMTISHQLTVGSASSTATDTLALGSYTTTLSGTGTGGSAPFQVTSHGTTTAGTSTVNYTGAATTDVAAVNYYNLGVGTTADATSTTYNLTQCGSVTTVVSHVLTIGALSEAPSNPDHLSGGSCTLELSGTGTPLHPDNGDYIVGTSTVNYTGADGTNPIDVAALSYYNLGIGTNADSTATTYQLTGNTTVTHFLNLGAASSTATDHLAGRTFTLTLSGTGTGANAPFQATAHGDYVVGTSTVRYVGDGATTDVAALSYYNLEIGTNVLGTATTYDMIGTTTVTNKLILGTTSGQNATFDANGSNFLVFTGGGTGANAPFQANTTGIFAPSTGTVEYDGSTDTDVPARTFYNLKFNPPSGSPNFYLLAGTLIINNSLAITTSGSASEVVHAETYNPTINLNADFSLSIGTFIASATATFTVKGNWSNAATFTANGGTVTFNSVTSGKTIDQGGVGTGYDFYNVVFNGSGGVWSAKTHTLVIDNDLTMTAGTVDNSNGSADIQVDGNVGGTAGVINLTANQFSQRVASGKTFGTTSGSTAWTFNNLIFSNSTSSPVAPVTITTNTGGTGSITVSGRLKVGQSGDLGGATTTLDASNRTWNITGAGTGGSAPFQLLNGPLATLVPSTSTFNYTGNATTDIQSATYYNLIVNHSGVTFNAGGGITVNNQLTVTAGTFSLGANDITVGSTGVTDSGTIAVAASGIYSQTAAGTTYVRTSSGSTAPTVGGAGTLTFYNLNFNQPSVGSAPTIKLGSGASQTLTINGGLTVGTGSQAVTVTAATNTPTIVLGSGNTAGDMLINASGTFVAPNCASCFTVNGNWTNNGTFTANSGTVVFNSSDIANRTLAGTLNGSSAFSNLTFDSGGASGFWTYTADILVTGNFAMTNGNLAGSNNVTVNGTVSGGANGIVRFFGGTFEQRVNANKNFGTTTGSNAWTFNNLTFSNSNAGATPITITTAAGTGDVTVTGVLSIGKSGDASGATTTLNAGGRNWNLTGSGSPLVPLASPAGTLTASTSTFNFSGTAATNVPALSYNNLNLIPITSPTYTFGSGTLNVAGTLNVGSGTGSLVATAATNNPTISVTGTTTILPGATLTDGTGSQTFSGDLIINGTLNGAGSLTANGNVNGSGAVNLTGGTFTQSIAASKNFGSSGGSNDWVFNNLTLTSTTGSLTTSFNLAGTGILETNGTLTLSTSGTALTVDNNTSNRIIDADGDFSLGANVTLSAAPLASFTVAGSWTQAGTLTANSGTVTFDEGVTGAKSININTGASGSFYNLTFAGTSSASGDAWSPKTNGSGVLTVTNDLTMNGGTLGSGADTADVTVNGNVAGSGGIINTTAASRTFTQRVAANKTFGTTGGSTNWTFTNLTFSNSNSGATAVTISVNPGGMGSITAGGTMNIGSASDATGAITTLDENAGNRTWTTTGTMTITSKGVLLAPPSATFTVKGNWTNDGTFTNDSGTITLDNATNTGKSIGGATAPTGSNAFNNLTVDDHSCCLLVYRTSPTNMDVTGNMTINGGFKAPSGNLNVGGNWNNTAGGFTFDNNSGTVIFNAGSTGKTIDEGPSLGQSPFYNATFNNANGGWTVQNNYMTVSHNLTLTALSSFTVNSSLVLEVDGTYSVCDSCTSGTTWTGSTLYLNSATNYTVGSKTQSAEVYGTLQVGANTDIRTWNSSAATDTVNSSGSLYSQNDANVNGVLKVYGDYHTLNGNTDCWRYDKDFDCTTLATPRQVFVNIETGSGRGVTQDSTGTLKIVGGRGGPNQFTSVDRIGGSGAYNLSFSGSTPPIVNGSKLTNATFNGGDWSVIDTIVTSYTVAAGSLTPIWNFSIHIVDRDNPATNIQTASDAITVAEKNATANTVWAESGGFLIGGSSQTNTTDSTGHIPQDVPTGQSGGDGAMLVSEFTQTSSSTTYYTFNVTVSNPIGTSKYNNYDYTVDGVNHPHQITSTANSGTDDKVIGANWYRDNVAQENPHPTVNGAPTYGSWYLGESQAIILMYDQSSGTTTVPSGWTCVSCVSGDPFFQKFPRGNTSYGATGGTTTVNHSLTAPTITATSGASSGTSVTGTTSFAVRPHSHSFSGSPTTSTDSIVPPYHNLKIVRGPSSGPASWPQNIIAPFETTSVPTNWSNYSTTAFPTTDYLRGDETIANGANGGAATHTHTGPNATVTLSGASPVVSGTCVTGCATGATAVHTHTIAANAGTTSSSNNNPQFADVDFMQCTNAGGCSAPSNVLGLFDYTSLPANWTTVSSGAPYNKSMLRNNSSVTGTGNAAGGVLSHNHGGTISFTTSTASASATYLSAAGTAIDNGTHTHTVQYTVSNDTENSEPPYIDVVIAKFAAPTVFTISGTVYQDEGSTKLTACDGVTNMVKASVGGALTSAVSCNLLTGAYTIASINQPAAGTPIVIWIDGTTCNGNNSNSCATTVTRYSGSGNASNEDLWKNRLILSHDDAGPVTNADAGSADNSTDPDIIYSVSTNNLTLENLSKLVVKSSKTYKPGGTVTTNPASSSASIEGDVTISSSATLNMEANALSVGGDYVNNGTFSDTKAGGTNQVTTFTGTTTGFNITEGSSSNFDSVVFNGSGGGWQFTDATATLDGTLTMTSGTLSGSGNITLSNANSITSSVTGNGGINLTGGTFKTTASGNFGGTSAWNFNNLTFGDGSTTGTTTALTSGGGNINVAGVMTIAASQTLQAGSHNYFLTKNGGTNFSISGTFTPQTSTITYQPSGTTQDNVTATTYHNVTFDKGGASASFLILGAVTTDTINGGGNFSINNGTVDNNGFDISVGGNWAVASGGSFTAQSLTRVTFNATSSGHTVAINSTTADFYDVTFNGTGGWSPSGSQKMVVGHDLTMTAGTFDTSNGTGNVEVRGNAVGTAGVINFTSGNTFIQRIAIARNFGPTTAGTNWTFNNLVFANSTGSGLTVTTQSGTGTVTVGGQLRLGCTNGTLACSATDTGGTTLDAGNRSWTLSGSGTGASAPFIIQASPASTLTANISTFNFTGAATTDVQGATYYKLVINHSGVTFNASSSTTVSNLLTVTAGTYALGANNLNMGSSSITNSGSISVASGASLTQSTGTTTIDSSAAAAVTLSGGRGGGTVSFGNLTLDKSPTAGATIITLGDATGETIGVAGTLTVAGGGGTGTVSGTASAYNPVLNVTGDVAINASGTLVAPPTSAFTVGGNWTNSNVFTNNGGTVTFNATATGKTLSGTLNGSSGQFNNLTFNGTGGGWSASSAVTVTATLTVTDGTLSGTNNWTVNGSVLGGNASNNSGIINLTGGTFEQRVAAGQNFGTTAGSGNWTFNNLTFSDSTSTGYTIVTQTGGSGSITVTSALNIGKGGDSAATTLNAGNRLWILSGTGTPLVFNASSKLAGNTSTFRYTGNGATNITASTGYNNLEIYPGGASVTHTLGAGTFSLSGFLDLGGFNNAANTTVTAATNNPTISSVHNLTVCALPCTNQMTFTKGSNTITLSPDGTKTWSDNNPTTKQDVGVLSIAGGTSSPTIQLGTDVKATYVNLATGHTLDANGSHNLILTGTTNTFFVANGVFIPSTGTVTYQPTTAGTVTVATATYHHVVFDGSLNGSTSTFNLSSGGLTTDTINNCGDLTIKDKSTLDVTAAAYAVSVGGNWTVNTGGAFTSRTGTVTFNDVAACGAKSISGVAMTGSNKFYNLTFNGSGGAWDFGGNSVDVGGNFTLTAGTVTAPGAGKTLTLNGNWTNSAGNANFVANSGQVTVTPALGGTSTLTGATTFYDFTSGSGDRTLSFQHHTSGVPVITFAHSVSLNGTSGHLLNIVSDLSGTQWKAHFNSAQNATYLNVKDGGCDTGTQNINMDNNSVNSGNNDFCWVFGGVTPPNAPTLLVQKRHTAGTILNVGDWTNETTVDFFATVSDPNSHQIMLCVEAEPVGTAFFSDTAHETCGSLFSTGQTATVSLTLADQTEYHWQTRAKNDQGSYSLLWVAYPAVPDTPNLDAPLPAIRDFGIDAAAVGTGNVYDNTNSVSQPALSDTSENGDGSLTTLSASWSGFNFGISGFGFYEYSIGTSPGDRSIKDWTKTGPSGSGVNNYIRDSSLSLQTNVTYYFNVRATNLAGTQTTVSSDGLHVTPTITFGMGIGGPTDPGNTSPPYAVDFGTLNLGSVNTTSSSQKVWVHATSNSVSGFNIYLSGQNGGLLSQIYGSPAKIDSVSGSQDLSSGSVSEGFGAQAVSGDLSNLSIVSPYNGSGNTVGPVDTTIRSIFNAASPVLSNGVGSFQLMAKPSNVTPAATDYKEVLTVIMAASY